MVPPILRKIVTLSYFTDKKGVKFPVSLQQLAQPISESRKCLHFIYLTAN